MQVLCFLVMLGPLTGGQFKKPNPNYGANLGQELDLPMQMVHLIPHIPYGNGQYDTKIIISNEGSILDREFMVQGLDQNGNIVGECSFNIPAQGFTVRSFLSMFGDQVNLNSIKTMGVKVNSLGGSNNSIVTSVVDRVDSEVREGQTIFGPVSLKSRLVLPHIADPEKTWYTGVGLTNQSQHDIDVYFRSSMNEVVAIGHDLIHHPGSKFGNLLRSLFPDNPNFIAGTFEAYLSGSIQEGSQIIGDPVQALSGIWVQGMGTHGLIDGQTLHDFPFSQNSEAPQFCPLVNLEHVVNERIRQIVSNGNQWNGFALTNFDSQTHNVKIEHLSGEGQLVDSFSFDLEAGEKQVMDPGILGLDLTLGGHLRIVGTPISGWCDGVFLYGDLLARRCLLGGGSFLSHQEKSRFLAAMVENNDTKSGLLYLINTTGEDTVVTIHFTDSSGARMSSNANPDSYENINLSGFGTLVKDLSEFNLPSGWAFLHVSSSKSPIIGHLATYQSSTSKKNISIHGNHLSPVNDPDSLFVIRDLNGLSDGNTFNSRVIDWPTHELLRISVGYERISGQTSLEKIRFYINGNLVEEKVIRGRDHGTARMTLLPYSMEKGHHDLRIELHAFDGNVLPEQVAHIEIIGL